MKQSRVLKEIEADGYTFLIKAAPFYDGLQAGALAGNIFGPVLASLGADVEIRTAFGHALQNPGLGGQLSALVRLLAPSTEVQFPQEGDQPPRSQTLSKCVDEVFGGRLDLWLTWMVGACEVNLKSFFGALRARLADAEKAAESQSRSRKAAETSGGSSE